MACYSHAQSDPTYSAEPSRSQPARLPGGTFAPTAREACPVGLAPHSLGAAEAGPPPRRQTNNCKSRKMWAKPGGNWRSQANVAADPAAAVTSYLYITGPENCQIGRFK